MDAPAGREREDEVLDMIYTAPEPREDGEDEDYSSQFLNDYGEGDGIERRDEGPLTNSGEVY